MAKKTEEADADVETAEALRKSEEQSLVQEAAKAEQGAKADLAAKAKEAARAENAAKAAEAAAKADTAAKANEAAKAEEAAKAAEAAAKAEEAAKADEAAKAEDEEAAKVQEDAEAEKEAAQAAAAAQAEEENRLWEAAMRKHKEREVAAAAEKAAEEKELIAAAEERDHLAKVAAMEAEAAREAAAAAEAVKRCQEELLALEAAEAAAKTVEQGPAKKLSVTFDVPDADNLAELVLAQAAEAAQPTGSSEAALPQVSEEQVAVMECGPDKAADGAAPLVESDGEIAEEDQKKQEDARALVEMGFKVGAAHCAVKEAASLEEAANILLEKESPTPGLWQNFVNWFAADPITSLHRPGKYKICRDGATIGSATVSQFEDTIHGLGASTAQLDRIEVGQVVDIVEVQVNNEEELVRGRMADGRWVSIASTSGVNPKTWAMRVPLTQQLADLGYTESQACEAEKRCSTVEGAVKYLKGEGVPSAPP